MSSPVRRALSPRAFTLLEALLVIGILGIAFASFAAGLANADAGGRLHAAVFAIQRMDHQARLLSRSGGAGATLTLAFRSEGVQRLTLASGAEPADEVLSTIFDQELELNLAPTELNDIIQFDRCGRSPDYEAQISSEVRHVLWRVYGLTGAIEVVQEMNE